MSNPLILRIETPEAIHAFPVELFDNLAPATCAVIRASLPLRHTLINARWSGPMGIIRKLPFPELPLENPLGFVQCGDLIYHSPHRDAGLVYGVTQFREQTGSVYVTGFGRVLERLDELNALGRRFQVLGEVRMELSAADR